MLDREVNYGIFFCVRAPGKESRYCPMRKQQACQHYHRCRNDHWTVSHDQNCPVNDLYPFKLLKGSDIMRNITELIIALNVSVFLYMGISGMSEGYITANFAFSGENISNGKYWVPFTALLIHGNIIHLILNSIALFFFGNALEPKVGNVKYLLIYLAG